VSSLGGAAFPFDAVVGQDELKLALLLAAVDPAIGGVLIRGEKGTAKSTLARGLAALLPGGAPFVELPVGATEDRLVGTLDLQALLAGGEARFRPGLLAAADGGVLYVDEVNLLPDHLVDVLLDVAASGVNRVEREGVSHAHSSRFVLIGSMNPEEGELRPQLLDRFGLAVTVVAPTDPDERAEAVRRRLAFDRERAAAGRAVAAGPGVAGAGGPAVGPGAAALGAPEPSGGAALLAAALAVAVPAELDAEVIAAASRLALASGVEGLRADLVLCRAAAALAGWEGRPIATLDDLRRVAPLALAHRARRNPFDPPELDPQRLREALEEALGESPGRDPGDGGAEGEPGSEPPGGEGDGSDARWDAEVGVERRAPAATHDAGALRAVRAAAVGRRLVVEGDRGRLVGDREPTGDGPSALAVTASLRHAVRRRAESGGDGGPGSGDALTLERGDLRQAVRVQRSGTLVVFVLDTSGSMGASERMEAATGALLGMLTDAYQRRDRVALVTCGGGGAEVVLRPTGSVEVARARLVGLPTGGVSPLAEGLRAGLVLARAHGEGLRPLLVVLTDGRATGVAGAVERAFEAADEVRASAVDTMVLDAELDGTRLGLAAELAERCGGRHVRLEELSVSEVGAALARAVS